MRFRFFTRFPEFIKRSDIMNNLFEFKPSSDKGN